MVASDRDGQNLGAGIRSILEELRDLRLEMRSDRQHADEDRKRADEDRKRADEDRKRADEDRKRADEDRKRAEAEWRRERLAADRRLEKLIGASARREVATQRAFKDIRTVGLVIARTLDRHTRILERIDNKLGARRNGPPRSGNGGRASV